MPKQKAVAQWLMERQTIAEDMAILKILQEFCTLSASPQ